MDLSGLVSRIDILEVTFSSRSSSFLKLQWMTGTISICINILHLLTRMNCSNTQWFFSDFKLQKLKLIHCHAYHWKYSWIMECISVTNWEWCAILNIPNGTIIPNHVWYDCIGSHPLKSQALTLCSLIQLGPSRKGVGLFKFVRLWVSSRCSDFRKFSIYMARA